MIIVTNDENLILLIHYMAGDGLNESQIAKKLGITKNKLRSLLRESNTSIDELFYKKILTQYAVEEALLKKALGGTTTEVKQTDKGQGVETVKTTKEIAADTTALQFWLKNKYPQRWGEKASDTQKTEELLEKIFNSISSQADALQEVDTK